MESGRIRRTVALVLAVAGPAVACGDHPFRGSEFEVATETRTVTYDSSNKVQPCNQNNSVAHDNYGVDIGSVTSDRYFSFRIVATEIQRYRSETDFRFEVKIDEGATVQTYTTDCEASSTLEIEGKDYGLYWGEASGELCELYTPGNRISYEMDFAFASTEQNEPFGNAPDCP